LKIQFPKKVRPLFKTLKKYIVAFGGRASSKSWGAAAKMVIDAAQGHRGLCFREVQNSIKESSFELVMNTIDRLNIPGFTTINNEISHKSGGKLVFKGLKGGSLDQEKTRIKSLEGFTRGWGEEASSISSEHLNLIMPTFRLEGSQILFSYNRFLDADPVHDLFVMKDRTDTEIININYWDNPFCPRSLRIEADTMKESDYDMWLHVYGGEPLNQSENSIMSISEVVQAMERKPNYEGATQIGADIARYGADATVFYKRKGMAVVDEKVYKKQSIPETARKLVQFANRDKKVPIKIDDTGVGGGVTDIVKEYGYNAIAVNNGASAKDKNKYPDSISESWFEFSEGLHKCALPNDQQLKQELTTRFWKTDMQGRRVIESKKEYKKRGFKSPDKADALLLCFYNKVNGSIIHSSRIEGW
jgi:phage terminase large subunit